MRILLAEDDETLASGIALALTDSGYAIDTVSTGIEAYTALSTASYVLAILDLGLPVLDGLEVIQRGRAAGLTLPILILTHEIM